MKPTYTAVDLVNELVSFTPLISGVNILFTNDNINKKVTASKDFKDLLRSWANGAYDEDPDLAMNEIDNIIRRLIT